MKALLIILVIVLVVVLATVFGPGRPETKPATAAQPAAASQTGIQPGMAPATAAAQTQPQQALSPRQQGGLSAPAAATGVTTETVNVGGGGAVFEAKRRITDKVDSYNRATGKR